MRTLTFRSVLCCLSLFTRVVSSQDVDPSARPATIEDDWPVFRGDVELSGFRRGTVGKKPSLLWRRDLEASIESTAAIASVPVFAGTGERSLVAFIGTGEKGLVALSATDGEVLWIFPCEMGVRSSPGVLDGRVYFGDDGGIFRALNAATGTLVWEFDTDTGAEIASSAGFFGDLVIFGSYDAFLYALDRNDGHVVWKLATEGPVHATPAIASAHTFVAGCDELLRTVSIRTGQQVGAVPMNAYSAASPAVFGDRLVVGTFGQQVICVRWREPRTAELAPVKTSESVPEGESRGHEAVVWTYEHPRRSFPFYASPAVGTIEEKGKAPRQVVVIGGRDKLVHALAADSGESLWTFPTKAAIDASPVIVGGHVIVCGLDGRIYCLDLTTGAEFWTYDAGTPFRASPAIARGKLIVSSDEGLVHCFDLNPRA